VRSLFTLSAEFDDKRSKGIRVSRVRKGHRDRAPREQLLNERLRFAQTDAGVLVYRSKERHG